MAELDPQAGLNRLIELSRATAMKKGQQQALILGFMRSEERFNSAIEASIEAKRTSWLGLAVAEADCGVASISNQINHPCPTPLEKASNTTLAIGKEDNKTLIEILTAYNLTLALNPKHEITMAKIIAETPMDSSNQRAAAQALRVHYKRQSKRSPEVDLILSPICQSKSRATMGLCQEPNQ